MGRSVLTQKIMLEICSVDEELSNDIQHDDL